MRHDKKNSTMKTMVFDGSTVGLVLSVFEKKVDEEGYIVECVSGQRVLSPRGDEVRIEDFAGITPGSEIILTKDLPSLLQYAERECVARK